MILIVEDNPNDSYLLEQQLEEIGLEDHVQVIEDGRDALDFLLQVSPAPVAVFLDLHLPGLNGIQLLRAIRQEPRFHALPILVVTNWIAAEDAEICARLGVCAFSPKPLNLQLLKTLIRCGNLRGPLLPRPVDPHLANLASPMLQHGT